MPIFTSAVIASIRRRMIEAGFTEWPYDQYARLREHDPVHWHREPDGPGFWFAPTVLAPVSASAVVERSTGVRWAWPSSRSTKVTPR